jgi:hypothetical protein
MCRTKLFTAPSPSRDEAVAPSEEQLRNRRPGFYFATLMSAESGFVHPTFEFSIDQEGESDSRLYVLGVPRTDPESEDEGSVGSEEDEGWDSEQEEEEDEDEDEEGISDAEAERRYERNQARAGERDRARIVRRRELFGR